MVMVTLSKNWFLADNRYYLMVDLSPLGSKSVIMDSFRMYNMKPGCESVVDLNKKITEFDMIEKLRKITNEKDIELV